MLAKENYDYIIFDVDDTLLDYSVSEMNAFRNMLGEIGIDCNRNMIKLFDDICNEEWDKKNLSDTLDKRVQETYHTLYFEYDTNRFQRLKDILDIPIPVSRLSEIYLEKIANETTQMEDAFEVCKSLSLSSELVIATNGLSKIQRRRLESFSDMFCKIFISEELGSIKPSKNFFDTMIE